MERGFSGGGLPYGYRSEAVCSGRADHRGQPIPDGYRLVVDDGRAAVVRDIYRWYVDGFGIERIAKRLNDRGVDAPRPRKRNARATWCPSALRSLIMNPIYRGEYIWNRSEWIKDHETGRRKRYERPPEEWVTKSMPELRIVDDALWERAQETREGRSARLLRAEGGQLVGAQRAFGRRPNVLSGMLACGVCGGGFHILFREKYGCSWHYKRGEATCTNRVRVNQAALEERVVQAIAEQILVPEIVARVAERAVEIAEATVNAQADADRLAELDRQAANLVRLAADVGHSRAQAQLLVELEREAEALRSQLSQRRPFDRAAARAQAEAAVSDLRGLMGGSVEEMRCAFRRLLGDEKIVVEPDVEGFKLSGTAVLDLDARTPSSGAGDGCRYSVVAGAGFEPATFGL